LISRIARRKKVFRQSALKCLTRVLIEREDGFGQKDLTAFAEKFSPVRVEEKHGGQTPEVLRRARQPGSCGSENLMSPAPGNILP
jgi:hypothetical protein